MGYSFENGCEASHFRLGDASVGVDVITTFCKAVYGFGIGLLFDSLQGSLKVSDSFWLQTNTVVVRGIRGYDGHGVRNNIFTI